MLASASVVVTMAIVVGVVFLVHGIPPELVNNDGNIEKSKTSPRVRINPSKDWTSIGTEHQDFFTAARKGDLSGVKRILQQCPDIDVNKGSDKFFGTTPLGIASYNGETETVQYLLKDKRIKINKANKMGVSPLLGASMQGNMEVVEVLLREPEIDVNMADSLGSTPLIKASYYGKTEVAKLLLRCPRTDISRRDLRKNTALYYAKRMWPDIVDAIEARDELLESGHTCSN